jgi:hypothetical protein
MPPVIVSQRVDEVRYLVTAVDLIGYDLTGTRPWTPVGYVHALHD